MLEYQTVLVLLMGKGTNYILSFSVLRFLHLNACFPESTHDAYVLSKTLRLIVWGLKLPTKTMAVVTIQSPRNQQGQKFNDAQSKTRVVVEMGLEF